MSSGLINSVRLGDQTFNVSPEPTYLPIEYIGFVNQFFESLSESTGFPVSALKGEMSVTNDYWLFKMYQRQSSPTIGADLFNESPLTVAINRLSGGVHHERTSYLSNNYGV